MATPPAPSTDGAAHPRPHPRVTVVVVTWQGAHLLGPCLESLARQTLPHDVVVVDNASTDDTATVLAAHQGVRVIRN